jgi:hypothetical protein
VNQAAYELGAHVLEVEESSSSGGFNKHPSAFVVCNPSHVEISYENIQDIFNQVGKKRVISLSLDLSHCFVSFKKYLV